MQMRQTPSFRPMLVLSFVFLDQIPENWSVLNVNQEYYNTDEKLHLFSFIASVFVQFETGEAIHKKLAD